MSEQMNKEEDGSQAHMHRATEPGLGKVEDAVENREEDASDMKGQKDPSYEPSRERPELASLPAAEPLLPGGFQTPPSSGTATVVNVPIRQRDGGAQEDYAIPSSNLTGDYFDFEPQPQSSGTASQPSLTVSLPVTPGPTPKKDHAPPPQDWPTPQDSPSKALSTLSRTSPQAVRPPTSDPATTRPVSVPELQNVPGYPDQTFASLGPRSHPPPPPTRMGRTLSSHSPHWSQSSIKEAPSKEPVPGHNGARTVGNTPAQSPGLFLPTIRSPPGASRRHAPESEDGRPASQILQAAHQKPPIETHKLNKDIDPISGRKVLNNYELIEKLGSGQHGTVKRGRDLNTEDPVAVKIVRRFSKKVRLGRSGDPSDSIKKEVAILKKARHPHVVSLYEVIDDPEFDKVYLVLEFVERSEIVWRKETEKAIGIFEKERMEREITNGYDEEFERQAVNNFNLEIEARRREKEEYLEMQKRQAYELQASGQRFPATLGPDRFWSLEHGGDSDNDYKKPNQRDDSHENVRMSRADVHAAENLGESPQSATPMYSTRAMSHAINSAFSTSQPSSQPTSTSPSVPQSQASSQLPSQRVSRRGSMSLDGTMYGPYVEEKTKSDLEFQQILNQIMNNQSEAWSYEAEEYQYVPCLTLSQASDAFRDTVLGIEYLHYQGIIHRDIKPANLLWTLDYRVKISDFGVSYLGKPIREDSEHEDQASFHNNNNNNNHDEALELAKTVGTPAFYAPELCDPDIFDPDKRPERPAITGQIDVWALGVTLYCMIFGRLPFFDHSEFRMYEKIARDEVLIPRVRLKGVSHTDKTPSNHNKRLDDVLEYEEVDDTLRDLLRRLLVKHPSQRITLKEVKHHPWVIGGIEDKDRWLDETDPSRQSEGKKIEVSTQEVQDAVAPLNFVDRALQRISSVFGRGRSSRKRTVSNPKAFDPSSSAAALRITDERRTSLRGDEQFVAALKHSREVPEHPLAHSVAASPGSRPSREYFGIEAGQERPHSALEASDFNRAPMNPHSMSTTDSMKTITARDPIQRQSVLERQQSSSTENLANTTHVVDQNSSSSSLGGIFSGASRRIAKSFRSRERGLSKQSPAQTSRSSSVDANSNTRTSEDYHASPSLGFSSAIAAGHVDLPPALREEVEEYQFPNQSSAESFQRAREVNQRRHQAEFARYPGSHRRSVSYAADIQCPPSPDDDVPFHQQRPASAAESSFAISSSSDQIVSGDSTAHSRIPSVVSRASSLSAPMEEDPKPYQPLSIARNVMPSQNRPYSAAALEETISADPAIAKARAQQEEEAGYNGEEDQGSSSEDEGLAMA